MRLEELLAGIAPEQEPSYNLIEQKLAPEGVDVAARTAVGEAESEGDAGQLAVLHTIRNRMMEKQKPAEAIVKAPKQFQVWNADNPRRPIMEALDDEDLRYQRALEHARKVFSGEAEDNTGGATFFKRKGSSAAWEESMEPTVQVGKHEFYKKPKKRKS